MRLRILSGLEALIAAAILTGCGSQPETAKMAGNKVDAVAKAKAERAAKIKRAAAVKANELGQIPVLMFHRIVPKPQTTDDRTPAQFRADPERLVQLSEKWNLESPIARLVEALTDLRTR